MKRFVLVFSCALVLSTAGLFAGDFEFLFHGVRFNFALLSPVPLPTGADVEFRYAIGRGDLGPTALCLRAAGGYEDKRIVRDPLSGNPIAAPTVMDNAYRYHSPNAQWDFGLLQSLVPGANGNLAEAFLLYRGRFDNYVTNLPSSHFSDMNGLLGSSVIGGIAYKGVATLPRRYKEGVAGEISFEWGPAALNRGVAPTDFYRFDIKGQGYLPIYTAGDDDLNLFSLYACAFGSVDYAAGAQIPIYVMQSFGGRELRTSLGGSVRGYPSKTYDAALKAVANFDIRAVGPALFEQAWFVPIVYGFYDAGYYSGLPLASAAYKDASGIIMSTGVGIAVDVLDFAFIGARAGILIPGSDGLFPIYLANVASGKTSFFSVEFLLHY